jgi:two-component system, OmpR family, sensor histidine kinase QseC
MNKLSLRLRLIVWFIGISCVVWLAAGVLSWKETKEKVDEFFDTYKIALARQLAGADWSGLAAGAQKITDRMIENVHNADDEDEAIGFAVFDRDGRLVFHDNENGKEFRFLPATGSFIRQIVDGDDEWRIVWLQSADGKFYIAVGQEEEYRADVVWDMTEEFMIPWAAGLFVLMVMIVAVLTREFRPLGNLADSLQSRGSGDLSPLEEKGIPAEILPLVKAMNIQMARIEGMLAGERRFVADAAHELRTPLTALQVQLEVAEMAGSDEKMRAEALDKLQKGIERSSRLVEQLLVLSKVDTAFGIYDEHCENINWQQIADDLQVDYAAAIAAKKIDISVEIGETGPVERGNPLLWTLLLRNLLDNALKYSPEGASVKILVAADALTVVNSGFGQKFDQTAADDRPRMRLFVADDFKGIGQQTVAGQNGGGFVKLLVAGWFAAAEVVIVHGGEIVVNERIGMQHFKRDSGAERFFLRYAEQDGAFADKERPQAFAAVHDRIFHGLNHSFFGAGRKGKEFGQAVVETPGKGAQFFFNVGHVASSVISFRFYPVRSVLFRRRG